ncbi:MAG: DUF1848 family protein [Fusobacteriaceae bacterium]
MRKIISVSRRADVIAQSYPEFLASIEKGYIVLQNPYFPENEYTVSLAEKDVHSFVLWSKDFSNFIRNPEPLKKFLLFFQYTINIYPKNIENVISFERSLENIKWLIENFGAEKITLRFDPVFFVDDGQGKNASMKNRLEKFATLVDSVRQITNDNLRIATSYITLNKNILGQLAKNNIKIFELDDSEITKFFADMKSLADEKNITLFSCSDTRLFQAGISRAGCIDSQIINKYSAFKSSISKDSAQRKDCLCTKSVDIGIYPYLRGGKKCVHGCKYCYVKGSV